MGGRGGRFDGVGVGGGCGHVLARGEDLWMDSILSGATALSREHEAILLVMSSYGSYTYYFCIDFFQSPQIPQNEASNAV